MNFFETIPIAALTNAAADGPGRGFRIRFALVLVLRRADVDILGGIDTDVPGGNIDSSEIDIACNGFDRHRPAGSSVGGVNGSICTVCSMLLLLLPILVLRFSRSPRPVSGEGGPQAKGEADSV
jgi:hypothetical protein